MEFDEMIEDMSDAEKLGHVLAIQVLGAAAGVLAGAGAGKLYKTAVVFYKNRKNQTPEVD